MRQPKGMTQSNKNMPKGYLNMISRSLSCQKTMPSNNQS